MRQTLLHLSMTKITQQEKWMKSLCLCRCTKNERLVPSFLPVYRRSTSQPCFKKGSLLPWENRRFNAFFIVVSKLKPKFYSSIHLHKINPPFKYFFSDCIKAYFTIHPFCCTLIVLTRFWVIFKRTDWKNEMFLIHNICISLFFFLLKNMYMYFRSHLLKSCARKKCGVGSSPKKQQSECLLRASAPTANYRRAFPSIFFCPMQLLSPHGFLCITNETPSLKWKRKENNPKIFWR